MPSGADTVTRLGDDLLGVDTDGAAEAQALAKTLRESGFWRDAVGGIDTVVAQFDPLQHAIDDAVARLQSAAQSIEPIDSAKAPSLEIPVVYDGEDLDHVCTRLELDRDEFIALHTRDEYVVDMLGFVPGFTYVGGLDPALDIARLTNPKPRVPAGSVGIAGGRTGLYALDSPGGWPIVGHTSMCLFDATADDPFVLSAGMRIRFVSVDGGEAS